MPNLSVTGKRAIGNRVKVYWEKECMFNSGCYCVIGVLILCFNTDTYFYGTVSKYDPRRPAHNQYPYKITLVYSLE